MGVSAIGEADGGSGEFGGSVGKVTDESSVIVVIVSVLPEGMVVVKVVSRPGGSDGRTTDPMVLGGTSMVDPEAGCDNEGVVKTGVRVAVKLERLGGAILFSHSVVPLMTE